MCAYRNWCANKIVRASMDFRSFGETTAHMHTHTFFHSTICLPHNRVHLHPSPRHSPPLSTEEAFLRLGHEHNQFCKVHVCQNDPAYLCDIYISRYRVCTKLYLLYTTALLSAYSLTSAGQRNARYLNFTHLAYKHI